MKKKTLTGLLAVFLLTMGTIIGMTGCTQSDTKTSHSEPVQVEQNTEADSQLSQNSSSESVESNEQNMSSESNKSNDTNASSAESDINSYKADAEALNTEIQETTLAETQEERRNQYYTFEKKIADIEDKLDLIEDTWENDYHAGKVSRSSYRSIENQVEAVEDYLDTVEDTLEKRFNYEFDD